MVGPGVLPGRVAVVTDSTAALPPALARAGGVRVVSLDVIVGRRRTLDGDIDGADLLAALERGERPVTSQPPPGAFAAAYERAAAEGASAVVSVHLSGQLSGTAAAARLAAADAGIPVVVVDSGTAAMGMGFAVLAAARAGTPQLPKPAPEPWWRRWAPARAPVAPVSVPDVDEVAATAQAVAGSSQVWFLVDNLDHLRRGGRLSGTSALLGTLIQLRPLLTVTDGHLAVAGKVRTRRAARARLVQLAVESVQARGKARVAVHHLGNVDAAADLARQVVAAAGDGVVQTVISEIGAVLAAHVGPGALAIAVADAEPVVPAQSPADMSSPGEVGSSGEPSTADGDDAPVP
ncbi:MAG: DegV family protein [Micrococcales bacterium]|nr:DegV family protein [Micrococcales bacterium]MCL2666421.1 DegV family protein [Micrococcales bacterium]